MSVADLVRRLQSRPNTTLRARPGAGASVRTVAPGANTTFRPVRTPEPAPMLALRPVFAPGALFAPKSVEVLEKRDECSPAGSAARAAEAADTPAALFDKGRREAFDERAAIMEFDGGLSRSEAEAAARQCVDCEFLGRRRTCLEPVAAGLLTQAQGFGIVWPPADHADTCAAFNGKAHQGHRTAVAGFKRSTTR